MHAYKGELICATNSNSMFDDLLADYTNRFVMHAT